MVRRLRWMVSRRAGRHDDYAGRTRLASYDSYEAALYHVRTGEPPTPAALAAWQAEPQAVPFTGVWLRLWRWLARRP